MQIRPTDSTVQDFLQKHFVEMFHFFPFGRRNSTTVQELLTVRSVFSDCKSTKNPYNRIIHPDALAYKAKLSWCFASGSSRRGPDKYSPLGILELLGNAVGLGSVQYKLVFPPLSSYLFSLPTLSPFLSFTKTIECPMLSRATVSSVSQPASPEEAPR